MRSRWIGKDILMATPLLYRLNNGERRKLGNAWRISVTSEMAGYASSSRVSATVLWQCSTVQPCTTTPPSSATEVSAQPCQRSGALLTTCCATWVKVLLSREQPRQATATEVNICTTQVLQWLRLAPLCDGQTALVLCSIENWDVIALVLFCSIC